MDNNAIMQRVHMLSNMWSDEVKANPDVKTFCWTGMNSAEFKLIKGFILFQTSLEKTLDDVFICINHTFETGTAYGKRIIQDMHLYIQECNKDEQLNTGIEWQPGLYSEKEDDGDFFVKNLETLAKALLKNN